MPTPQKGRCEVSLSIACSIAPVAGVATPHPPSYLEWPRRADLGVLLLLGEHLRGPVSLCHLHGCCLYLPSLPDAHQLPCPSAKALLAYSFNARSCVRRATVPHPSIQLQIDRDGTHLRLCTVDISTHAVLWPTRELPKTTLPTNLLNFCGARRD